jgi:translation initiation factor 1
MQRLFAGTPFDRPPTCERCGLLESECQCPPPVVEPVRIAPETQTARVRLEKRARGKVVTVVANLPAEGNDLPGLAAQLKVKCGSGGTVKDGLVEIQGDHVATVESALKAIGYRTKRG